MTRKWIPLLTICLGTFMLMVDITVVNVALPSLIADVRGSFGSLQWVVDGYALTLAAFVLTAGSVGDLVGHRRVYVAGLAVFAAASLVCGLAPGTGVLVGARLVQGAGGAAMFATTVALLNATYTGRDRGTAYGVWGAVASGSASVGPVLGGLLTVGLDWRWIFFVNLPVSALAVVLARRTLTDRPTSDGARVDVAGMALFTSTAAAVTYALIRVDEQGWSDPAVTWLLAAAAVALVSFVAVERRSRHPMLDLALLRRPAFAGVVLAGVALTFAAFAVATYTTVWMQTVLGMGPVQAGLVGLAMTVTTFAVSVTVGRLLHGPHAARHLALGLLVIGAGGLLAASMTRDGAGWPALVPGFVVIGVGVGLSAPTLGSAALAAVPANRGGMAAGAVNTARQLGVVLGVAVLGSVFTSRVESVFEAHAVPAAAMAARQVAAGQSADLLAAVPDDMRVGADAVLHAAALSGVQASFVASGTVGLLAGLVVLALVRSGRPTGGFDSRAAERAVDRAATH